MTPVENKFIALPKVARLRKGREWVYFLRADCEARLVKVGHSTNLKWRLTGLQTQCPVQLSLIGLVQAPAGAELVFHEVLSSSRAHGEWFYPSPDLERIRGAIPKAGQMTFDDLVALVEPMGLPLHRIQKIVTAASTYSKHCDEDSSPA